MIHRAFNVFEHSNGRIQVRYLVYDAKGDLVSQEDIPAPSAVSMLDNLFFSAPGHMPDEQLSELRSTESVSVAGDETGVKEEKPSPHPIAPKKKRTTKAKAQATAKKK